MWIKVSYFDFLKNFLYNIYKIKIIYKSYFESKPKLLFLFFSLSSAGRAHV